MNNKKCFWMAYVVFTRKYSYTEEEAFQTTWDWLAGSGFTRLPRAEKRAARRWIRDEFFSFAGDAEKRLLEEFLRCE